MRFFWVGVLMLACTSVNNGPVSTDTDTGETDTADTDMPLDVCVPNEDTSVFTSGLFGFAYDQNGGAVECFAAQYCSEVGCMPGDSNGTGSFSVPTDAVGTVGGFEIIPLTDTYAHLIPSTVPITIDVGSDLEIDTVLMAPDVFYRVPENEDEVSIGAGLHVSLGRDTVKLPFGGTPEERLAAVEVPPEKRLPVLIEGNSRGVLGMWYLSPFDTQTLGEGMALRVEDQWGLDAEKTYEAYEFQVDKDKGYLWISVGEFALQDGFLVAANAENTGLKYLSTLVLLDAAE